MPLDTALIIAPATDRARAFLRVRCRIRFRSRRTLVLVQQTAETIPAHDGQRLLAWEGASGILPHLLQKMSILYYLQSLCPVPAPMDDDAPTLIRLLAAPAAPASRPGAILGLLLLTAFVLWIGGLAVRRMQISYGGTET